MAPFKDPRTSGHSAVSHLDYCCMCFPLRLGILLVAAATTIWSAYMLLDRRENGFKESVRHFTGGYSQRSAIAVGFVEVTGVFFGIVGVMGCWLCKPPYVWSYNAWQVVRLLVWVYMFTQDVPLMLSCEDWVNKIDQQIEKHGWNDVMYNIAMSAKCQATRTEFFVCSIAAMLFFMYLVWQTHKYLASVEEVPRYLLRMPKDLAAGCWYAHSLGERQNVEGNWGRRASRNPATEHSPLVEDFAIGPEMEFKRHNPWRARMPFQPDMPHGLVGSMASDREQVDMASVGSMAVNLASEREQEDADDRRFLAEQGMLK